MPNELENDNDDQQVTELENQPPVATAISSGSGMEDDDPEFANMTTRERALVTKARAQEKRKLYGNQEQLKKQVTDLQTQLRDLQRAPAPRTETGEANRDAAMEQLRDMIQATQDQIRDMREQEVQNRRKAELRSYARERINEMRNNKTPVVGGLVGGESEEEIDISIGIARAEYLAILADEEALNPTRRNGSPSSVTVQQTNGRPAGTPPVMTPNSVEADSGNEIINQIAADPDAAVRSGAYSGAKRTEILGRLRRGYKYGA